MERKNWIMCLSYIYSGARPRACVLACVRVRGESEGKEKKRTRERKKRGEKEGIWCNTVQFIPENDLSIILSLYVCMYVCMYVCTQGDRPKWSTCTSARAPATPMRRRRRAPPPAPKSTATRTWFRPTRHLPIRAHKYCSLLLPSRVLLLCFIKGFCTQRIYLLRLFGNSPGHSTDATCCQVGLELATDRIHSSLSLPTWYHLMSLVVVVVVVVGVFVVVVVVLLDG